MKKTGLLLGLLALVACEQQELEYMEGNSGIDMATPTVQTRAATSSISDFDPLKELEGIPLNIMSVENTKNKYLSAKTSGEEVVLYNKDDGSGRQRWYYDGLRFNLKKGREECSKGYRLSLVGSPMFSGIPTKLALINTTSLIASPLPSLVPVNDQEYIFGWPVFNPSSPVSGYHCVEPKSSTSDELTIRERNSGAYDDYYHWVITPVGTFRLVKMEYEKSTEYNDQITALSVYCDSESFGDSPFAIEHEFVIKRDFTETSYFSEAYGVTTNKESGVSWNFTVPSVNISFSGNISESTTPSEDVNFSQTTTNTLSVTRSFKMTIPSHTPCRIEIMQMMYNASLTYVATLEKTDGDEKGKQFRIKGRWSGMVGSEFYFNVYDTSNNLIETSVIPEGTKSITIQD